MGAHRKWMWNSLGWGILGWLGLIVVSIMLNTGVSADALAMLLGVFGLTALFYVTRD